MEVILISLLRSIGESIVGDNVKNLLDKLIKKIKGTLQYNKLPTQNQVERTIRKSYLLATLLVCHEILKRKKNELGWKRFFIEDDNINWLTFAIDNFEKELSRINTDNYPLPFIENEINISELISPKKQRPGKTLTSAQTVLENQLIKELQSIGKIPDEFIIWIEADRTNNITAKKQTWFEVVCGFFAEEVRTNAELSNIIQATLISNLSNPEADLIFSQIIESVEIVSNDVLSSFGVIDKSLALQMHTQSEINSTLTEIRLLFKDLIAEKSNIKISIAQKYVLRELSQLQDKRMKELSSTELKGRTDSLKAIDSFIEETEGGRMLICSPPGFGKSALAANWIIEKEKKGMYIVKHFFYNNNPFTNIAYSNILRQLFGYYNLEGESIPENSERVRDIIFGLIEERKIKDDLPLVIFIDAIDEADIIFSPPLPTILPKGVFLIATLRTGESYEIPDAFKAWDCQKKLLLSSLNSISIMSWMNNFLTNIEDKHELAEKIYQKTQGYPLYLKYFFDELKATGLSDTFRIENRLNETPNGFQEYIKEQFTLMAQDAEIKHRKEFQLFFALLSVSRGALSEDDIERILGLTVWDLSSIPWKIERWLTITNISSEKTFSIAHPLLAEVFSRLLGQQTKTAFELLLSYCANWQQHNSNYALQYYVEKLLEADLPEKGAALICGNNTWVETKRKFLGSDKYVLADIDKLFYYIEKSNLKNKTSLSLKLFAARQNIFESHFKITFEEVRLLIYSNKIKEALEIIKSKPDEKEMFNELVAMYILCKEQQKPVENLWNEIKFKISDEKFVKQYYGQLGFAFLKFSDADLMKEANEMFEIMYPSLETISDKQAMIELILIFAAILKEDRKQIIKQMVSPYLQGLDLVSQEHINLACTLVIIGEESALTYINVMMEKEISNENYCKLVTCLTQGNFIEQAYTYFLAFEEKVKAEISENKTQSPPQEDSSLKNIFGYYFRMILEFATKGEEKIILDRIEFLKDKNYLTPFNYLSICEKLANSKKFTAAQILSELIPEFLPAHSLLIYILCSDEDNLYSEVTLFALTQKLNEIEIYYHDSTNNITNGDYWLRIILEELMKRYKKNFPEVLLHPVKKTFQLLSGDSDKIFAAGILVQIKEFRIFIEDFIQQTNLGEYPDLNYIDLASNFLQNNLPEVAEDFISIYKKELKNKEIFEEQTLSKLLALYYSFIEFGFVKAAIVTLDYCVELATTQTGEHYRSIEERSKLTHVLLEQDRLSDAMMIYPDLENEFFGVKYFIKKDQRKALEMADRLFKAKRNISRFHFWVESEYLTCLTSIGQASNDAELIAEIISKGKLLIHDLYKNGTTDFASSGFINFLLFCFTKEVDPTELLEYLLYYTAIYDKKNQFYDCKKDLLLGSLKFGLFEFASSLLEETYLQTAGSTFYDSVKQKIKQSELNETTDKIRAVCDNYFLDKNSIRWSITFSALKEFYDNESNTARNNYCEHLCGFIILNANLFENNKARYQTLLECISILGREDHYLKTLWEKLNTSNFLTEQLPFDKLKSLPAASFPTPDKLMLLNKFLTASIEFEKGNFDTAENIYTQIIQSGNFIYPCIFRRGISLFINGLYDKAEKDFEFAADGKSEHYNGFASSWLLRTYLIEQNIESFENHIALFRESDPHSYYSWHTFTALFRKDYSEVSETTANFFSYANQNGIYNNYTEGSIHFHNLLAACLQNNINHQDEALEKLHKSIHLEKSISRKNHLLTCIYLLGYADEDFQKFRLPDIVQNACNARKNISALRAYINLINDVTLINFLGINQEETKSILTWLKQNLKAKAPANFKSADNAQEKKKASISYSFLLDRFGTIYEDFSLFVEIILKIEGTNTAGRDVFYFIQISALNISKLFEKMGSGQNFKPANFGKFLYSAFSPISLSHEKALNLQYNMLSVPLVAEEYD